MNIVRTSLLSGVAVATRVLCALALNKVLALWVGPAGFALIGQLQSAIALTSGITAGALTNGITKCTAENYDDSERQEAVWRTAIRISLCSALVTGVVVLVMRKSLALWLLGDADYSSVFVWLALSVPAIGGNLILLALLNGKKEIGAFVGASVAGSVVGLVIVTLATRAAGIQGALTAVVISPAVAVVVTAALAYRMPWLRPAMLWGSIDPRAGRDLGRFAAMALTTAICVPLAQLAIRNYLGSTLGWTAAGQWQAMSKISEMYLLLITMSLATYYLPRIAELRTAVDLRNEISATCKMVLPATVAAAVGIYLFRIELLNLLFTPEFAPTADLFGWYLAGDILKIASWILGYVLIGKGAAGAFILSEVSYAISSVGFTYALVSIFGLRGVSIAHFLSYAIYLALLLVMVRSLLRGLQAR